LLASTKETGDGKAQAVKDTSAMQKEAEYLCVTLRRQWYCYPVLDRPESSAATFARLNNLLPKFAAPYTNLTTLGRLSPTPRSP
jgi:hypothetical protein